MRTPSILSMSISIILLNQNFSANDVKMMVLELCFLSPNFCFSGVRILCRDLSKHHILNANSMREGGGAIMPCTSTLPVNSTAVTPELCQAISNFNLFLFQLYRDKSTKRQEEFTCDELSSVQISRQPGLMQKSEMQNSLKF